MAERVERPARLASLPIRPAFWSLWLLLLVVSLAAALVPFVATRQTADWERWRATRAGLPLSPEERIYQLNWDIPGWLALIADFPGYYYVSNERINRPVYPAVAAAVCRLTQSVQQRSLGQLARPCTTAGAYAAAVAVNWAALALATFGLQRLLRHWHCSELAAFLAAAHLALAPLALWVLASASPEIMALAMTVAVMWLLTFCYDAGSGSGSLRWAIVAGLGIGLFMLLKGHYELVAVGWLALWLSGRRRAAAVSFGVHFLPLLAWIGILALMGLTYTNTEVERYDQVVWLWREFIHLPLAEQAGLLWQHTRIYAWNFNNAFGPVVLLAAGMGLWQLGQQRRYLPVVLTLATLIGSWAFLFAIRRPLYYLIAMCFCVVYPLATWAAAGQIERLNRRRRWLALALYLVLASATAWYVSNAGRYAIDWLAS